MNRSVAHRNCVLFCLVLIALAVVAAFAWAEASKPEVPEIVKLQQRVRSAAKEGRAKEAYEERDTEIPTWLQDALSPAPDNAALLYYQAFLLRPEPNMTTSEKIVDVLRGAESDSQIRTYLGHCLPMIQVAEIASRIPQCTWGLWNGPEPSFGWKDLHSNVSNLEYILVVDARTLAADGHYRAALEHCLTLRRLARHLSEDPRLDLAARNPDLMALRTVQYVLGVMAPDADSLMWFRGQLAVVRGLRLSLGETLQGDFNSFLGHMKTNPNRLAFLKKRLIETAEDEQGKEDARNLADDQLLWRAREPLQRFLDSISRIADSEMTYEHKCAQMQRMYTDLVEEYATDPIVGRVLSWADIDPTGYYPFLVGHQAHINGVKAAVEVYLVVAKAGRLPEKLPDDLPKDPFTGRDFVYEITDEGFALRCQGEEFLSRKNQFLEFKVRK